MRHCKRLKKLGRPKPHRTSMMRNLVGSLVLHGAIKTTESRAKAVAAKFDRIMKLVRSKDARESIRLLPAYCSVEKAQRKIVGELKNKYEKKASGFTRITRLGLRKGDNANLVKIELI